MQAASTIPNHPLRDALAADIDVLAPMLLASTLLLPPDGTMLPGLDGAPPGLALVPLAIDHHAIDVEHPHVGVFTDLGALAEHHPLVDEALHHSVTAMTGEVLATLAASSDLGICINPGSDAERSFDAGEVRELAARAQASCAPPIAMLFDQTAPLVALRDVELPLQHAQRALLVRELAAHGIHLAWIAEYGMHEPHAEPSAYTQLLVIGDEHGNADATLCEAARRIVACLTERATVCAAYDTMSEIRHAAAPILQTVDVPAPDAVRRGATG